MILQVKIILIANYYLENGRSTTGRNTPVALNSFRILRCFFYTFIFTDKIASTFFIHWRNFIHTLTFLHLQFLYTHIEFYSPFFFNAYFIWNVTKLGVCFSFFLTKTNSFDFRTLCLHSEWKQLYLYHQW